MPRPIQERIASLRKEIAQINEENLKYVQGGRKTPGAGDHERRIQRLQKILDELASLTDWKKT
jgi:hypothetical protein